MDTSGGGVCILACPRSTGLEVEPLGEPISWNDLNDMGLSALSVHLTDPDIRRGSSVAAG